MGDPGIRTLQPSDLAAAMRLKDAAGWNQTQQDWERLLVLEPAGCFGLERNGLLAATATAVTYGRDLAWIGMVLTLPEFRRHGLARLLMRQVVEFAERRCVRSIGLDATEMGISLYREFGFEPAAPVERWERAAAAATVQGGDVEPWQPALDLDRAAFGTDRSRLLESLAQDEAACIPGLGFAMGRPGWQAAYFGPWVARSADAADALLRWFLARHPGERVYQDIVQENRQAARLAERYGFRPVRRLTRMYRGPAGWGDPDLVFAIAGFEYG